jgi:hypothetical protein
VGKHCVIHSVLKKKTTKLKNKIDKDNSEKQNHLKKPCGETL